MPEIHYRDAHPDDLPAMIDLFLRAVVDVYARYGVTVTPPPRAIAEMSYAHLHATGILQVAEQAGQIVGLAGAVVRDRLWYLAAFWMEPNLREQGLGMPLLKRVWDVGQYQGATTFFVWSSVDPTAMSCYMKLGMLPGYPILSFEGQLRSLPNLPAGYEVRDLELAIAVALDQEIRGTGRAIDHQYWLEQLRWHGRQVQRNGQVVGYYYLNGGDIGPVTWQNPEDAVAILTLAMHEAKSRAAEIRVIVPGINHQAVGFAYAVGLRLHHFSHFLTTNAFGVLEQYLPSGPALY